MIAFTPAGLEAAEQDGRSSYINRHYPKLPPLLWFHHRLPDGTQALAGIPRPDLRGDSLDEADTAQRWAQALGLVRRDQAANIRSYVGEMPGLGEITVWYPVVADTTTGQHPAASARSDGFERRAA